MRFRVCLQSMVIKFLDDEAAWGLYQCPQRSTFDLVRTVTLLNEYHMHSTEMLSLPSLISTLHSPIPILAFHGSCRMICLSSTHIRLSSVRIPCSSETLTM